MSTRLFTHLTGVDSGLLLGKFKVCFLELPGIFSPPKYFNQWLVESKDVKPMDT